MARFVSAPYTAGTSLDLARMDGRYQRNFYLNFNMNLPARAQPWKGHAGDPAGDLMPQQRSGRPCLKRWRLTLLW
jgi:hypothetical protein